MLSIYFKTYLILIPKENIISSRLKLMRPAAKHSKLPTLYHGCLVGLTFAFSDKSSMSLTHGSCALELPQWVEQIQFTGAPICTSLLWIWSQLSSALLLLGCRILALHLFDRSLWRLGVALLQFKLTVGSAVLVLVCPLFLLGLWVLDIVMAGPWRWSPVDGVESGSLSLSPFISYVLLALYLSAWQQGLVN